VLIRVGLKKARSVHQHHAYTLTGLPHESLS